MTEKIDILFCGLVRKLDMFERSLSELTQLRKEGIVENVFFSTWKGELDKFPEAKAFLKEHDVKVIETQEPKDRGPGNIWCQMMAMEEGLKKIKKNRFVLKSRSDTHIKPEFIRKLATQKSKLLNITHNLPKGNIFKHKVWIVWYEITRPFYIADECFFGHKDDLKKLINYDEKYDTDYAVGAGISHIRRFIHPFLDSYPILFESLGKYNDWNPTKIKLKHILAYKLNLKNFILLRKLHERNRFKNLKAKLKDDKYLDVLAAYYYILYSHFYVNGNSFPEQVTFRDPTSPRVKLDLLKMENNFSKNKTAVDYGGQIHDYDMNLLSNICEAKIEKTELGSRLSKAVGKFKQQN